jgi:hypothetical protein
MAPNGLVHGDIKYFEHTCMSVNSNPHLITPGSEREGGLKNDGSKKLCENPPPPP